MTSSGTARAQQDLSHSPQVSSVSHSYTETVGSIPRNPQTAESNFERIAFSVNYCMVD